ncbi:MAG: hypothetical protein M3512_00145 [Bacteroidota bacterium]|nr:hypothetical protein [Bacteroidota bacterium]
MEKSNREITLYYKPAIKKDKNTLAMATQITPHIREVDVLKDTPTETQMMTILAQLGIDVEDIIERESEVYKEEYDGKSFDVQGWVQVLVQNPEMIKTPIAIRGNRAILVETPSNILDLDPEKGYNDLKA